MCCVHNLFCCYRCSDTICAQATYFSSLSPSLSLFHVCRQFYEKCHVNSAATSSVCDDFNLQFFLSPPFNLFGLFLLMKIAELFVFVCMWTLNIDASWQLRSTFDLIHTCDSQARQHRKLNDWFGVEEEQWYITVDNVCVSVCAIHFVHWWHRRRRLPPTHCDSCGVYFTSNLPKMNYNFILWWDILMNLFLLFHSDWLTEIEISHKNRQAAWINHTKDTHSDVARCLYLIMAIWLWKRLKISTTIC